MPLLERLQNIRWRHAVIGSVVLLLGVLLFGVIAFAGGSRALLRSLDQPVVRTGEIADR